MSGSLINVNKIINHSAILQDLGIKYKGDCLFAKCPICRTNNLGRFLRNAHSDETRYHCYKCRYSSDLFDMYREINGIDTVAQTFYDLMSKRMMLGNRQTISDQDIEHYTSAVIGISNIVSSYWTSCRDNLYLGNLPLGKQLLQTMGLWPGILTRNNYLKSAFSFIGISGRDHVTENITHINLRTGLKKKWPAFIVYPYEVTPGQVRNFVIQNDKGYKKLHEPGKLVEAKLHNSGDGFFMLSSVRPSDKTVYAFGEPGMALQSQKSHFSKGSSKAAPIVAWGVDTDYDDWYNLPGNEIIMYAPTLDADIFLQAMLCGSRAKITNEPFVKSSATYNEDYRTKAIPFHKRMEAAAKPWPEALIDVFMNGTVDSGIALLAQLPVGNLEKSMILDNCKYPAQVERVNRIFGSDLIEDKYVDVANQRVYEENGEWYSVTDEGSRTMVCSVPIYFEEIIKDPDDRLPMLAIGYIKHNNVKLHFTTPYKAIDKQSLKTYLELVMLIAHTEPKYDAKFGKHIMDASRAFQTPKVTLQPSIIGYSEDTKSFRLSSLLISGNGVALSPQPLQLKAADQPTAGLAIYPSNLPKAVSDDILKPGKRNETMLAFLGCFFRNILSYPMNIKHKPIGIIGGSWNSTLGWQAVADITNALNIKVIKVLDSTVKTIKLIQETCESQRFPVVLDTSTGSMEASETKVILNAVSDLNVVVTISPIQALALSIVGDWDLIDVQAPMMQESRVDSLWCVISYLEYYLKIGAPVYGPEEAVSAILDDMRMWLLPNSRLEESDFANLFSNAKKIAVDSRSVNSLNRLLTILCSFASMAKRVHVVPWVDKFRADGHIATGDKVVLIDNAKDAVYIDKNNLVKLCNNNGCITIDPAKITEIFSKAGVLITNDLARGIFTVPGWIIKAQGWNEAAGRIFADTSSKLYN